MFRRNSGMTLVELLVATTLTVIASAMSASIYIQIKDYYYTSTAKANIDIKQLTAKQIIYDSIIDSGLSCEFGSTNQTYVNNTGDDLTNENFLTDGSNVRVGNISPNISSYLQTTLGDNCKGSCFQANTDYIMTKDEVTDSVLQSTLSGTGLSLESTNGFSVGDYLALCNSQEINLVKISSIDQNNITLADTANSSYITGNYAGKFDMRIFYIGDTGETNNDGDEIYSLYLYIKDGSLNGESYELVRGLENLKVRYATTNSGSIVWNDISGNVDVDTLNSPALQLSFTINNESFRKTILL